MFSNSVVFVCINAFVTIPLPFLCNFLIHFPTVHSHSVLKLKAAGCSIDALRTAGVTFDQLRSVGFPEAEVSVLCVCILCVCLCV